MLFQTLWMYVRRYAHRIRRNVSRLLYIGKSRDGAYRSLNLFHLEVRRWTAKPTRWDVILWWPKVHVIKGKVERPGTNAKEESPEEDPNE